MKKRSDFEDEYEPQDEFQIEPHIVVVGINLEEKILGDGVVRESVAESEVVVAFSGSITHALDGEPIELEMSQPEVYAVFAWNFDDAGAGSQAFNSAIAIITEADWLGIVRRLNPHSDPPTESTWTNDARIHQIKGLSELSYRKKFGLDLRTAQSPRRYELVFNVSGRWDDEPVEEDGHWSANVQLFKHLVQDFGRLEGEFSPGDDGILVRFKDRDTWLAVSDRTKELMDEFGFKGTVTRYAHGHVKEYYRKVIDPDAEDWKSKMPEIEIE